MFEKLFMLIKTNAGNAVVGNPLIAPKHHEAIINDASSTIIDVLKGQIETGKLKDMVKYFQFPGIYNSNPLIIKVVNKFANKLNNFYNIEPPVALITARALMPKVMQQLIERSQTEKDGEFNLKNLLSDLTGSRNINLLLDQMVAA